MQHVSVLIPDSSIAADVICLCFGIMPVCSINNGQQQELLVLYSRISHMQLSDFANPGLNNVTLAKG